MPATKPRIPRPKRRRSSTGGRSPFPAGVSHRASHISQPTSIQAFTTLEVLVALGIFAFGFLALAAIFPVGLLMQKETTNSILAGHVADNGVAIMQARTLEQVDMDSSGGTPPTYADYYVNTRPGGTYPAPPTLFNAPIVENRVKAMQWDDATGSPLIDRFGVGVAIGDRSYPSTTASFADREFFWVPLVQDPDGAPATATLPTTPSDSWLFHICVLQREPGITYAKPAATATDFAADNTSTDFPTMRYIEPTLINGAAVRFGSNLGLVVGDLILDGEGIQYIVLAVDNTNNEYTLSSSITSEPEWFWYAPPGSGTGSPLVRIKQVLIELDN